MTGSVSVLTLVRSRSAQLSNLIAGLGRQTRPPDQLVIARMGEAVAVPPAPFPVDVVDVAGDPLPLAAARNAAAAAATGDLLVFLDVDCIPGPTLCAAYAEHARAGCLMGEVRYLPHVPAPPVGLTALDSIGVRHPAKPAPPERGVAVEPDHGELWGLSFALTGTAFWTAGGFDEDFVGYGGEETDFAHRLRAAGTPLYRLGGAPAYHQAHPVASPPLNHFASIVANARRFHARWGSWCMTYWLEQFAARGLIEWSPTASALAVVRAPTENEIAAAKNAPGTLFG